MTSVSVVVACRNEIRRLRAFLDTLVAQDLSGLDCEAIVADGGSTDGTRPLLEEYARAHRHVRVIDNPGRIVSTGLNAAIRQARGEIIVRLDAHTEYAPDYVRSCVTVLQETGADNVGGPTRTRAQGLVGRAIAAAYHCRFASGGARFHQESYEGWVDTVQFGCWRRETLLRLGLFDETLVRNQDDELNLRLARAGGRIWQSQRIVFWYRPRATLGGLFQQHFQYGYWKVAVIRKHRRVASWRHLAPGGFVAANLALLAWSRPAWLVLAAVYGAACLAAALATARRHGWGLVWVLPAVFATYHVSYGLGFLWGMIAR